MENMYDMYNMRSPAVKRLMREAQELYSQRNEEFHAQPLDDNLFEWHFTVRGPSDSDFANGFYHGRIVLPAEYPMKPPSIILLTPNGRFEVNKKICLSISGHHPESWQPSWSIRTVLLAIIGFMPTSGNGAIGSLDYTSEERRILAKKSENWQCSVCGCIKDLLLTRTNNSNSTSVEAVKLASQISFKSEADQANQSNTNGHVLNSETQRPTTESGLPLSRLLGNPIPIPLPDAAGNAAAAELPHFPMGMGVGVVDRPDEPMKQPESVVESPNAMRQRQTLIQRVSSAREVSSVTAENAVANVSPTGSHSSQNSYYIIVIFLSVVLILLLFRRFLFL